MNARWGLGVALLVCAPLAANAVRSGDRRVTELRLNTLAMEGQWYAADSPLARSLGIRAGHMALYTIAGRCWPEHGGSRCRADRSHGRRMRDGSRTDGGSGSPRGAPGHCCT